MKIEKLPVAFMSNTTALSNKIHEIIDHINGQVNNTEDGLETRGLTENSEAEAIVNQMKRKYDEANKQPEAWEKEFDYFWVGRFPKLPSGDLRDVKSFIRFLITSQRASDVRRLEGMKKNGMNGEGLPFENSPEIYGNAGDQNTGDRNTGDWNTSNDHVGSFNTIDADEILVFNKMCKKKVWNESYKPSCLYFVTKVWIEYSKMSDEEKVKFPASKTTGGYLKDIPFKEAFTKSMEQASTDEIEAVKALPNFDRDIFFSISGFLID